ncbi:MAG: Photosystem I assembly protein Ycf3 [Saprospiraceae bacterium]|nr:Photosystem I assembly protein Ycf3 [Saprospiraceae bacterium]
MAFNMKTIVFCLSVFFVLFWGDRVEAQVADSAAVVREVDSLIQISRALTGKKDFDKALEVNVVAEKIALERFGKESAAYGSACFNHGRVLHFKGDFSEVEKWYLEAKAVREKILGKEHSDYTANLNNLAALYRSLGNYEKAEPLYLETIAIQKKILGNEHPDHAASLNNLAILYKSMGNYEKAEPLYLEALAIRKKILGENHPDYARSLYNLAGLYSDMVNYEKAEPLYLETIAIQEKILGKEHPDYAWSLSNLANLYDHKGNYEKAELLYVEALAIKEKILGKNNPDHARTQNNLAVLYTKMGAYEKAELFYLETIAIRKNILGKNHPDYAWSLNNLALMYFDMGNYEKAEPLYLETIAIWEKIPGKENPGYASSLNNLANLYNSIGNFEKAKQLYHEALPIQEKILGKEHPDYVQSLNNLAVLFDRMGNHEKSEQLYIEILVIRKKTLGKAHPDYAQSLNNMAILYWRIGNHEKAELLYLEALSVYEKTFGKEHPIYAQNLNNLANLYLDMGNYEKAEQLFVESLAIWEKVLGDKHPEYAWNQHSLAKFYWTVKKFNLARHFLFNALKLDELLLLNAARHLSEKELTAYIRIFADGGNQLFSFAQMKEEGYTLGYNFTLFHKGFLLNAVSQIAKLSQSNPAIVEKYHLFKSYHHRLAKGNAAPFAERDSANVVNLEEKANNLEKELTRTVASFGEASRQVEWQEVQAALRPEEATIEFVHYEFVNPKPTDSTMYAALVLLPSDTAPHFIPLFEQKQLNTLLSKTQSSAQSVGNLYAAARSGIVLDEIPAYGTELYNLIWKPLDSLLQGVKTIYFSPSGLLHRVNLAAIPVDSTHVLADRYTLRQMSSTRNLVVKTPEPVPAGYTAALFGGIQYNTDSTALSSAALASRGSETPASRSTLEYTADAQRDTAKAWNYLEGTRAEVDSLQRQMQRNGLNVKTFTGLAATEESLKALGRDTVKSPDILHIATHGFFFDDPEKRREQRFGDENVFRWNENPLFRSGLIMAGADHAWQTGRPYANLEDGICTAYEISHLNLSNTKLAVLSACETGLGDIKGSEGVYGLQRAFKMAGVDYLIVSLWKVPDAQTVEFMDAFYRNWLGGETIHEAFAKAQQMMRQKYGVYEWGAWVLIE